MRKVKEHKGKKKLDDWRLCKIIGTEKFNDTTILIDNKLPEDITLKNVILIRCVKKDDNTLSKYFYKHKGW